MEIKIVLSLIAVYCFYLVECCEKNAVNACKDSAQCSNHYYNNNGKGKRSIEKNRSFYALSLSADPCDFKTYDLNSDGIISKDEFYNVLGVQDETDSLFMDLDSLSVDNAIKQSEFEEMSSAFIADCFILKNQN